MSSRRAMGRTSHAERYAITATQEQLDASAARKLKRTGPRHGQRLAMEMRFISAGGHGRKLAAARHIVAAQERNLRDELDDMRESILHRHDPLLARRYADPIGARRDAVKAGLHAKGVL